MVHYFSVGLTLKWVLKQFKSCLIRLWKHFLFSFNFEVKLVRQKRYHQYVLHRTILWTWWAHCTLKMYITVGNFLNRLVDVFPCWLHTFSWHSPVKHAKNNTNKELTKEWSLMLFTPATVIFTFITDKDGSNLDIMSIICVVWWDLSSYWLRNKYLHSESPNFAVSQFKDVYHQKYVWKTDKPSTK
jgi:hypothetical protein